MSLHLVNGTGGTAEPGGPANRAERRAAARGKLIVPPGYGPQQPVEQQLRREQQVEVTLGADGVQHVKAIEPPSIEDPCYECACCQRWTTVLEIVRTSVASHVARVPAVVPCPGDCIACATAAGEGPLA